MICAITRRDTVAIGVSWGIVCTKYGKVRGKRPRKGSICAQLTTTYSLQGLCKIKVRVYLERVHKALKVCLMFSNLLQLQAEEV